MKTCDEMVNSLLQRREQFLLEQRKKRKTAAKITAAGGSCALAAVIGVLVLNSGMLREKKTIVPDDISAITDNSSTVSDNSSVNDESGNDLCDIDPSISPDDYLEHLWNGKIIYGALYKAFGEYDDEHIFKVTALCSSIDNFEYDNIDKYIAAIERPTLINRLIEFGDELKYGEALYTTGTPEGVKWDKDYYDETVSFIGKELIEEYIVDGEFLRDKAERDHETACNELEAERELYEQAFYDYDTIVYGPLMKQLQEKGISCELKRNYHVLFIDISENDLADITLDDPENWRFQLVKTNDDH